MRCETGAKSQEDSILLSHISDKKILNKQLEKAEAISNLKSNISNLNTAYLEKSGVIMTFAYLSQGPFGC